MYGYIRAYKPEMRFREYDIYHGCYCGLCDALHKRHGAAARWTLSYDMTFLILLLTGLYEPAEEKAERRCIAHPFHKSLHIQSEITAYAADMSILLFRDKCMDDWNDERKITRRAAAEMFRKSYRRIQAQYPQKCKAVQAQLDLLHQMTAATDHAGKRVEYTYDGVGNQTSIKMIWRSFATLKKLPLLLY